MNQKVQIVTFAPLEQADVVRQALGDAGTGIIGKYSYCSFSVVGTGRFSPDLNANPHTGTVGQLNSVTEERIEVICDKADAKQVITALRSAHPYEEVAFFIYPIIGEDEL